MEYGIGVILSLTVTGLAAVIGFDREHSFYPTVLIVIASYYVLFAVMGGSRQTLLFEIAVATAFSVFAILGFKHNLWLVAAAIAAHGLFDFAHYLFIDNPGVPNWWPGFCATFDVIVGGWVAVRLIRPPNSLLNISNSDRHARS
jgi:hypothetical protein